MRLKHPLLLVVSAALAAALASALAFPAVGTAAECGTRGLACKWLATWAASPMAATPARLTAPDDFSSAGFNDQTIRDIVWTSVGGQAVRISLSNRFGRRPVTFGQVDIGLSAGGSLVILGTNHRVTFAGKMSVTIPPGAAAVSDPVRMTVPAQTDLAVSMFTSGP